MAKFLIIRFSSIGDIVLTSPVIRCLKKQVPGAEVHFLTKSIFAGMVENNPYIDKVHLLASSWETMIHMLKVEKFDYIIDLHNNLRSFRVKKTLKAKSYSYNKLNIQKWVYVNLKWNLLPDVHIADRYMETVSSFSVENDQEGLEYYIPEKDEVALKDIPTSHHAGYIGLVIGAVHSTKKLPVEKLQKICSGIIHPIILLGGKDDAEIGAGVSSVDPVKIYNACGKFNLNESADLVRKAKIIITHDTGLMHIAAAFKKPIISVWGNTVPEFGMYPYYGDNQIPNSLVQVHKLKCRPCSKIGYKKCPKGHFNCMNKLSMDKIIDTTKVFLQ